MIQIVLLLAIAGLVIGQVLLYLQPLQELFEGSPIITPKEARAINDGLNSPTAVYQQQSHNILTRDGLSDAELAELEQPHPYHPSPSGQPQPRSTAGGLPSTPYLNLVPRKQEDVYQEDNPLDLPWIASWSVADRYARRGNNCAILYTEEGPDGTTIETVSKSCESNMPHTQAGDRIIIPDTLLPAFKAEVLSHELVHIYQRRYPDVWWAFYKNQWAFQRHEGPPSGMPSSVVLAKRANPDTWDPAMGGPWTSWQGRWWPVPVYTDPKMPTLRAAITVWWDNATQEVLTESPASWRAFFGSPSQDEHPHEIAAVMVTAKDTSTEAGRRLLMWWNSKTPIFKKF